MTLGPVVAGAGLPKDEVVWPEDLPVRSGPHRVHGSGLEVDEDGPGDVFPSGGFVVVDIDPLQLELRVTVVGSGGVDTMLVRDDLPDLGSDLVAALAGLEVDDFSHSGSGKLRKVE